MNPVIREERLKIPTLRGGQLFLRKLSQSKAQAGVLLLHGLGGHGDLFLKEGHGLANYLCEMGFTCYIPDMIGHGQSWPHRSRHLEHSLHDVITEDLPRLFNDMQQSLGNLPIFLVGQGFGSVLLLSALAKNPDMQAKVSGLIHFNARRLSPHRSGLAYALSRFYWKRCLPLVAKLKGETPVQWGKLGIEPESAHWYQQALDWSDNAWVDPVDQFNYGSALRSLTLPPSLYFASRSKRYWTHTNDVREFMRELGTHNARLLVLAKGDGNLRNYDTQSIVQHDDAWVDHFPVVLDWLQERVRVVRDTSV